MIKTGQPLELKTDFLKGVYMYRNLLTGIVFTRTTVNVAALRVSMVTCVLKVFFRMELMYQEELQSCVTVNRIYTL